MCVHLRFLVADKRRALGIISRKSAVISVLSGTCAYATCSHVLIDVE